MKLTKEDFLDGFVDVENMTLPKLRAFVKEHSLGLKFAVGSTKHEAYERILTTLKEGVSESEPSAEQTEKADEPVKKPVKGTVETDSGIPPFLQRRMHLIKAAQAQTQDSNVPLDTRLKLRQEAGGK